MAARSRSPLSGFEQLETLGVGLHHAVLDAVVDHLDEVPAAVPTHVVVAVAGRGERSQDGADVLEGGALAADHEAVAHFEAPYAAAGAGVEVADAFLRKGGAAAHVVLERRVAAVDEDVVFGEQRHELVDDLLGGVAVRQHQPDDARLRQRGHDAGQLADGLGAFRRRAPPPSRT